MDFFNLQTQQDSAEYLCMHIYVWYTRQMKAIGCEIFMQKGSKQMTMDLQCEIEKY